MFQSVQNIFEDVKTMFETEQKIQEEAPELAEAFPLDMDSSVVDKEVKDFYGDNPERELTKDEIMNLQSTLSSQGFDVGPVDGLYGPKTNSGINEIVRQLGGTDEINGNMKGVYDAVMSGYEQPNIEEESMNNNVNSFSKKIEEHLKLREGFRDISYNDSLGKLTGGVGHLLTPEEQKLYPLGTSIPKEVTDRWFVEDTEEAREAALTQSEDLGILDEDFIVALTSVNFQLGTSWNKKFPTAYKHLKDGNYERAIKEIEFTSEGSSKKSNWAKQTPVRVADFVQSIRQLAK